jgi:3-oxoadipate enol-lactonase
VNVTHLIDGPETKPVLVLSNSLGTTWELWDAQLGDLTRYFRVLRYDHPGHSRSETPSGPISVEALAEGVVELLDRLELERVSFCGLSLGGMVGMALALAAPERVDRLALCCTAAYLGPADGWLERARLVRAGGTAAIAERVLERWFTRRFHDEFPATVRRFREMLEATPPDGYAACCEAIARWDARASVAGIRVPTLVIAGAEDVATPPEDGAVLATSIPAADLAILPGAAHLANVEQPEAFNRALLGHLSVPTNSEEAAA